MKYVYVDESDTKEDILKLFEHAGVPKAETEALYIKGGHTPGTPAILLIQTRLHKGPWLDNTPRLENWKWEDVDGREISLGEPGVKDFYLKGRVFNVKGMKDGTTIILHNPPLRLNHQSALLEILVNDEYVRLA